MGDPTPLCAVCGASGPLTCAACKKVSYCGKDHQKRHWAEHKHLCRPFEVRVNGALGRHLVASRDIEANEVLYSELPTVVGPKVVEPSPVCLGCLRPPGAARCPSCGWPACQTACPGLADPHRHATECKILSLSPATQPDHCRYECILPLRCLLMQKRNPRKWKIIMSMETHMDKRGPSTEVYKEIEENVVRVLQDNYFSRMDEGLLGDTSSEVIHRICGAIDVNALEITEGQSELLSLLPTAFIMCHSCVPNTKHTFRDTRITVRAAVAIPKGKDITTMYTHMLWTTQARREHLWNTKYFKCMCERCSDPTELGTHISALRCLAETSLGESCGGFQYPSAPLDDDCDWACTKCPMTLSSREVCELISCLDVEVENIQLADLPPALSAFAFCVLAMYYMGLALGAGEDPDTIEDYDEENKPTVDRLEGLLSKLEKVLHPHHYLCYKIRHSLVQLYGHQERYLHRDMSDDALHYKCSMCRDLMAETAQIDPGHGRLGLYSAVLHYELHAALMELFRRSGESSHVQEARKALQDEITFLPAEEEDSSPEQRLRQLARRALMEVNKALSERYQSVINILKGD